MPHRSRWDIEHKFLLVVKILLTTFASLLRGIMQHYDACHLIVFWQAMSRRTHPSNTHI
nr:MAG TPA: hypothetical protein [Inoviridae sp.]